MLWEGTEKGAGVKEKTKVRCSEVEKTNWGREAEGNKWEMGKMDRERSMMYMSYELLRENENARRIKSIPKYVVKEDMDCEVSI